MSGKKPIRVLHVVTKMDRAGLETMLMNYYRIIDRSKIQFDFLVHRDEKGDYDDEILKLGGKIYHFSPIGIKSMFFYASRMKNFLVNNPEYKIVHSHLDALSALPLSGAKRAGVPVRIAHSHNNGFSRDSKYFLRKMLKPLIVKYATDLFACSKSAGDFMFGKKNKHIVMKNAIDTKKYSFNEGIRSKTRESLGLKDSFVIGHVGRLTHQKNHDFLLDVFNEVLREKPNSVLLIVGVGELEDQIKEKVEKLDLSSKVIFLGVRSDIPELMQAMDVFALPSHYEGLGIVAIEAQATGLPCVLSSEVSSEAGVAEELFEYVSLISTSGWVGSVLEKSGYSGRKSFSNSISDAGYDIKVEAVRYANLCQEQLSRCGRL